MTNLKEHAASFVQLLQNAIEIRLGRSNDIATMADILNCEAWDCKSSGNDSMDQVILGHLCHFQEPLRQQGLQASQIEVVNEWYDMLDYTVKYLSPSCHHYISTWFKIFHSSRSFQWQNILLLNHLSSSVPVSNAVLERFFSSLGRVKNVKRASPSQQTLGRYLKDSGWRATNGELWPYQCHQGMGQGEKTAKSEKKESLQKKGPDKTPSSQRRFFWWTFIRRIVWGESF